MVQAVGTIGAAARGGGDPEGWDTLAAQWAEVRADARELRAVADELDMHATEWEVIIAHRGRPSSS